MIQQWVDGGVVPIAAEYNLTILIEVGVWQFVVVVIESVSCIGLQQEATLTLTKAEDRKRALNLKGE
jgi:hypothetical protein